jgi:hypothetical protein
MFDTDDYNTNVPHEPEPSVRAEEYMGRLHEMQQICVNTLKFFVDQCINNHVMVDERGLGCVLEVIEDAMAHDGLPMAEVVREEGFEATWGAPDSDKLVASERERLIDALRIKPVGASPLFRALAPTNPATLQTLGVLWAYTFLPWLQGLWRT